MDNCYFLFWTGFFFHIVEKLQTFWKWVRKKNVIARKYFVNQSKNNPKPSIKMFFLIYIVLVSRENAENVINYMKRKCFIIYSWQDFRKKSSLELHDIYNKRKISLPF